MILIKRTLQKNKNRFFRNLLGKQIEYMSDLKHYINPNIFISIIRFKTLHQPETRLCFRFPRNTLQMVLFSRNYYTTMMKMIMLFRIIY